MKELIELLVPVEGAVVRVARRAQLELVPRQKRRPVRVTVSMTPLRRKVLSKILEITERLLEDSRTESVSVKLRTLVRYGYVSYARGVDDISSIKGLMARVSIPREISSRYFYRKVEETLKEYFDVEFEYRRCHRYVTLHKRH